MPRVSDRVKVKLGPAVCQTHLSLRLIPGSSLVEMVRATLVVWDTSSAPGGPVAVIAGVGRERGLLRLRFSPQGP